jgi:hypothetical protein
MLTKNGMIMPKNGKIRNVRTRRASNSKKRYRTRIRMYRHGLGDCFLLTFQNRQKQPTHVMIDCGVVLGTKAPDVPMKKVAKNLYGATRGKIDVLVITHEHWDHLSGFSPNQAQKELDRIRFGELWLAWTEDEQNDLANALRSERALKKAAAAATKKRLKALGKKAEPQLKRLTALMEFTGPEKEEEDGGEGFGGTAGALRFLKEKISRQRIFRPGQKPIDIPGVGVRVYVMGPPEDKSKLHARIPGKGQGYGLAEGMSLAATYAAALNVEGQDAETAQPFAPQFRNPMMKLSPSSFYQSSENSWRTINDDWLAVGERLALQLDSDTNNTSLVLAFEFIDTKEVLLFVGDAQSGNWMSWNDYTWNVKDEDGEKREVTAGKLLENVIFYKVGHHGSHNATLRTQGLERMNSPKLVAMMPVDEKVAHKTKGWLHMPLPKLCDRLAEKCACFIRADSNNLTGTNPKAARVEKKALYFDYFL